MSRPAMLQFIARGSWRNVCQFDVADVDATDRVMEAAAVIATYGTDKPSVRVVKDEAGYALPLMRWTPDSGWRKA